MTLKWTHIVPWKTGIYLRNNPATCHVVRQDIYLIEGELCTTTNEGCTRLKRWKGAKEMWWYGPVPEPPKE